MARDLRYEAEFRSQYGYSTRSQYTAIMIHKARPLYAILTNFAVLEADSSEDIQILPAIQRCKVGGDSGAVPRNPI